MSDSLKGLKIKLFVDGANVHDFRSFSGNPLIKGYTTNPTLMKNAGVTDYLGFARTVLPTVGDRPISFEVIADDFSEIRRQAKILSSLGENVYVKIPIMNTRREPAYDLVRELTNEGLNLNVTAVMTLEQVDRLAEALSGGAPSVVSVFAGRIADTGRDPIPIMQGALEMIGSQSQIELLWASCRELLNVFQASDSGAHIITVPTAILKKLKYVDYDLVDFSQDTVQMFYQDAVASGLSFTAVQIS